MTTAVSGPILRYARGRRGVPRPSLHRMVDTKFRLPEDSRERRRAVEWVVDRTYGSSYASFLISCLTWPGAIVRRVFSMAPARSGARRTGPSHPFRIQLLSACRGPRGSIVSLRLPLVASTHKTGIIDPRARSGRAP